MGDCARVVGAGFADQRLTLKKPKSPAFAGDFVVARITISNFNHVLQGSTRANREAAAGSEGEIGLLLHRASRDFKRFIRNIVDEELFVAPVEDGLRRHGVGPLFAGVTRSVVSLVVGAGSAR